MKNYYNIPVWLLASATAIVLFASIDVIIQGHYFYGILGIVIFLSLLYYTFIDIKE